MKEAELSVSVKSRKLLDYVSYYQFLKEVALQ
jgi:hypothetical protein